MKAMTVKTAPRIKRVTCKGPIETVAEFEARGGKIERLPAPATPVWTGAIPVGYLDGKRLGQSR